MPDLIDALFDNANAHEAGPELQDRMEAPPEFKIGNRLSDLLEQAEKIVSRATLIAALEVMIRPQSNHQFTNPLLIDIEKTFRMMAQTATPAVAITRIQNRITRLKDDEFRDITVRQFRAACGEKL